MTFTTKISDRYIEIDNVYLITQPIEINWGISLIAGSQCLKGITVTVPDQDITVHYEQEELDENDNTVYLEKTISLKDIEVEYDWDNEDRSSSLGVGLCPQKLEIYKGKVTVTFSTGSV